ncbi:MAG: hypothetical protein ACTSYO_02335 [Candidatus Ranarchaeia archaeon]
MNSKEILELNQKNSVIEVNNIVLCAILQCIEYYPRIKINCDIVLEDPICRSGFDYAISIGTKSCEISYPSDGPCYSSISIDVDESEEIILIDVSCDKSALDELKSFLNNYFKKK